MIGRLSLGVAVVLVALSFAGCTESDDEGSTTRNVSATDNQFSPNSLDLSEDDRIKVTNDGDALHSVTIHKVGDAATQTKKNTDISPGTSTSFTFDEAGTYHVYCKYHSAGATGSFGTGMVLTVMVDAD